MTGTLTLKFDDSTAKTQREWKRELDEACRLMVAEGLAARARVHTVFPGDPDPEMAAMFTIDVAPLGDGMAGALKVVRRLPGLEYAEEAAQRRPMPAPRQMRKTASRAI
jgi:hypothetical protein